MKEFLHPISRFLVALIFLVSGAGKIFGFAGTAAMMGKVGFPIPEFFLVGAIVFEIVGGLMLMFGFKPRIGALLLILFLIPATLIFHVPGIFNEATAQNEMIQTLKNLVILGALLKYLTDGAGAYAVDNIWAKQTNVSNLKPQEA